MDSRKRAQLLIGGPCCNITTVIIKPHNASSDGSSFGVRRVILAVVLVGRLLQQNTVTPLSKARLQAACSHARRNSYTKRMDVSPEISQDYRSPQSQTPLVGRVCNSPALLVARHSVTRQYSMVTVDNGCYSLDFTSLKLAH